MGAAVGTGDGKKSVNVDLNLVPFIDLMSCLTAFLLATAVWSKFAQIPIQPKGKARDQPTVTSPDETIILSVLIQSDKIYTALSGIDPQFKEIPKKGDSQDWDVFTKTIADFKKTSTFAERTDLEIAAESTASGVVKYDDVVRAMDISVAAGFIDVGLSDPLGLTTRPQL
jgi:biopolymer transport protein ExbD